MPVDNLADAPLLWEAAGLDPTPYLRALEPAHTALLLNPRVRPANLHPNVEVSIEREKITLAYREVQLKIQPETGRTLMTKPAAGEFEGRLVPPTPDPVDSILAKRNEFCVARRRFHRFDAAHRPGIMLCRSIEDEALLLDFLDARAVELRTDSFGFRHILAQPGPLWLVFEQQPSGGSVLDPAELMTHAWSCERQLTGGYTFLTDTAVHQQGLADSVYERAARVRPYLDSPRKTGFQLPYSRYRHAPAKAWALASKHLFTPEAAEFLSARLRQETHAARAGGYNAPPEPATSEIMSEWRQLVDAFVNWQSNPLRARSRAEMELFLSVHSARVHTRQALADGQEEVIASIPGRRWRFVFELPGEEPAGLGPGVSQLLTAHELQQLAVPIENTIDGRSDSGLNEANLALALQYLEQAARFPGNGEIYAGRVQRMRLFAALPRFVAHLPQYVGYLLENGLSVDDAASFEQFASTRLATEERARISLMLGAWREPSETGRRLCDAYHSLSWKIEPPTGENAAIVPAVHREYFVQRAAKLRHEDYDQYTYGRYS